MKCDNGLALRRVALVTALFFANAACWAANGESAEPVVSAISKEAAQTRATDELRRALAEETEFIKVHAAEALIGLGFGEEVIPVFEKELELHGEQPIYRVGIWRVLAHASSSKASRRKFVDLLREVSFDSKASDQVHAIESLAKLRVPITDEDRKRYEALKSTISESGQVYLLWLLANSGSDDDVRALATRLEDSDTTVQSLAAYGLRHLAVKRKLPESVLATLQQLAQRNGDGLPPVYLESAAFVTTRDTAARKQLGELLVARLASSAESDQYEILSAIGVAGGPNDLPTPILMLDDADPDVRIAAANAVLRIERRKPLPFQPLDWMVLIGYAGLMIGIGVYYERRSKTTDDYLLGGRTMHPLAVGLSYYATLFSTISYLAYPSEMIQNGPLILSAILGYPLIYLVVSRLLIPFIMTLPVTSAYEILEQRLGLSVRMLGSTFFLLLRLLWMSVIIYATANTILVPLLRLDNSATPYVCLALGTLTVVYTSLGGLRAVIWTDVAQLLILFSGAILSILFVTYYMGGVGAWLPREWDPNWELPQLGFDPKARVTIASAILSAFVWYVCTAGSDQMAIQRYLATRDKRSAQRMFKISLISDASVAILLAILGLALHAYFRAHPQMLPDGETLATGADRLLPQFIVKGLPMGVTGLVIAGLLSAAMSSLSSGLNSSCTVITVDWIDRFRKVKLGDAEHMQLAKRVSWFLGTAIVVLSLFAGTVPGNLLEKSNKLVNLLTSPLFVLFFMAMFIPWATTFGTWLAAIASVAMAVAVSQYEIGGLSFLWIMPLSLIAGVVVGCLASFAPIGKPRPMLKVKQ